MTNRLLLGGLAAVLLVLPGAGAAEEFKDGDRVVLLGSTLIEREQRYGYWEYALTRRYPDRNVTFRNLGWSGDTVFGHARAGFGSTPDGFRHLKEHVAAVKPTVIVIAYGTNEAFDGEAGLPRFQQGLNTLLDTLAANKARMILLSPLPQEDLGRPLPDPGPQNKNINLYRDALKQTAEKRGLPFLDLHAGLEKVHELLPKMRLTDNGIHLTPFGYWYSAFLVQGMLRPTEPNWAIEMTAQGKQVKADGTKVEKMQAAPLRFVATDSVLPMPGPPADPSPRAGFFEDRFLRVTGLPEGNYRLSIDSQPIVTAPAKKWEEDKGVRIDRGPEFEQAEKLRAAIVAKNQLYFHRWRPQNETYLFGFRKAEQGKNAVEIPQFDPLVEKLEAEIAKLRVPVTHTYEIAPVRGDDK